MPFMVARFDQQRQVVAGSGDRAGIVVLGDRTADYDPGVHPYIRQGRIQNRAAYVIKIDVNAFRAMLSQRPAHVFGFVVNGCVESQFLHDVAALLRRLPRCQQLRNP